MTDEKPKLDYASSHGRKLGWDWWDLYDLLMIVTIVLIASFFLLGLIMQSLPPPGVH
jgi:hypothetical protein